MKNNAPPGMQPEICNRGGLFWESGDKAPNRWRSLEVWGRESPALQKFEFFSEKLLNFGTILIKINTFKTCYRNLAMVKPECRTEPKPVENFPAIASI